jgi:hypothetical protein
MEVKAANFQIEIKAASGCQRHRVYHDSASDCDDADANGSGCANANGGAVRQIWAAAINEHFVLDLLVKVL